MKLVDLVEKLYQISISLWPDNFKKYEEEINQCCISIALDTFWKLNLFQDKYKIETLETIQYKLCSINDSNYLINKLLYILCENKIIDCKNNKYKLNEIYFEIKSPYEYIVDMVRKYPEEGAALQWFARAFDGIYLLIKGKLYPEDILFPWGDTNLIIDLYNTSKIYSFYSKLAGITVKEIIENIYNNEVSLIEIGAGTGNSTDNILKNTTHFENYTFTDIARSFIKKSAKKYKHNFMYFKLLDISRDIKMQNFNIESFDIALAVNVLHAVINVEAALNNIYLLLKSGGCIIISEISPPENSINMFMELTFGLIPSYNSYNDKDLRPLSPLINQDKWIFILKRSGFINIYAIPYKTDKKNTNEFRGGVIIGFKK